MAIEAKVEFMQTLEKNLANSRKIKPIKRRFLKMYGKEAEVFFERCFTPPKCRKY